METPKTITGKGVTFDVVEFFCPPFIEEVNDSMQEDSGQEFVSLTLQSGPFRICESVRVVGEVRVIFRDQIYKCASRMPGELIKAYRDGKDPEEVALADGGKYETPYEVIDNNWLETDVVIRDSEGNVLSDSLGGEVLDADSDDAEGWFGFLVTDAISNFNHFLTDHIENFAGKVKRIFPKLKPGDCEKWTLARKMNSVREILNL